MEPRAGIINLDFVDATQIGKAINDNDPWKQAIQTAGTAVIDRERDILYRRALAKAMGLQAPQDTTAVEGIGKGLDWLGEQAGNMAYNVKNTALNAYDKAKNLIAPEMVEYTKEVGDKKVTRFTDPFENSGVDANLIEDSTTLGREGVYDKSATPTGDRVEFPMTVTNAPLRAPIQVGSKVDWAKPSSGYKTEFPTTVDFGSPIVKSPEASPVSPEEKAVPTMRSPDQSEQSDPNMAWAEAYRLSSDRANFDYGRKKDNDVKRSQVYTPEQKSIIDAKQQNRIRMGEIQGTINTMQTETSRKPWIDQLKTLAANDVALNNQLARLNTPGYNLSEQPTATKTESTGTNTGLVEISPTVNAEKFLEFSNGFDIKNYKDKSQTPSAASIQAQARKAGYDLSKEEAETIASTLDEKVTARNEEKARLADEGRKAGTYARSLAKDKAEVGALSLAYNKLAANPDDKTYKSSALTSILRKESGAAIGSSEFMGRMKEWLPESDYNQLMNEMNSVGMIVAGKFSPNAAELWANRISDNYLDKINTPKMMEFIYAVLPDYADVPGKGIKKTDTSADKPAQPTSGQYPMTKMINGVKWTKTSATSGWKK